MAKDMPIESFLGVRSARGPKFSADGKTVYFLSDESGVPQVWNCDISDAKATPKQLTDHRSSVSRVEMAATSSDLIYVMDRDGDERHQFYFVAAGTSSAKPLTSAPQVMHNWGCWSSDASKIAFTANYRDPGVMDVYICDLRTGERQMVVESGGLYTVEAGTADFSRLILIETIGSAFQRLHVVDGEGSGLRCLTPKEGDCRYQQFEWCSDNRHFYGLSNFGRDFLGFARFDAEDGRIEWLHTPDHDIEEMALSRDETQVAFASNIDGYSALFVMNLSDGTIRQAPDTSRSVITGPNWSPDGSALVFAREGSTRPSDIWIWDLRRDRVRQVTHSDLAGFSTDDWIEPELIHFNTFDDRLIPAFFYRPRTPRPTNGYPVIVEVHGGPEAQFRPSFAPELQFYLSLGYAVAAPNVRGSTGYGARYAALDDRHKRMESVRDLKHLHGWLAAQGDVDGRRIAISGGSYGGFMVLAALTEYPDLWKAAVEFYGIVDFQSFLERTGPWRRRHRAMEYGDPVADAALLRDISPLHKSDRIRAPLFVAQGLTDPRVPPHESEQIVQALRERSAPVSYLIIPDEGHGFVKLENRIKVYSGVHQFLRHFL
jgi:dipeptidyl aminopeptidase/acylaminoacyl peptidase